MGYTLIGAAVLLGLQIGAAVLLGLQSGAAVCLGYILVQRICAWATQLIGIRAATLLGHVEPKTSTIGWAP